MIKRILFSFATLAIAVAGAATHKITIYKPASIAGTEVQPGDYKVEVKDNKAVLTRGKQSFEAPMKVESSPTKFSSTTVRYSNSASGKQTVDEIRIGGTNTVLIFDSAVSMAR